MKNITYTQMRSDLSATLEALRSGESVKITQRGKPDLIICAKKDNEIVESNAVLHSRPSNHEIAQLISSNFSPQVKEGAMRFAKQLHDLILSDEAQKAMINAARITETMQGVSESFIKALQHTQTKHADIIKKLEDK